jgi:hypothetical protein
MLLTASRLSAGERRECSYCVEDPTLKVRFIGNASQIALDQKEGKMPTKGPPPPPSTLGERALEMEEKRIHDANLTTTDGCDPRMGVKT